MLIPGFFSFCVVNNEKKSTFACCFLMIYGIITVLNNTKDLLLIFSTSSCGCAGSIEVQDFVLPRKMSPQWRKTRQTTPNFGVERVNLSWYNNHSPVFESGCGLINGAGWSAVASLVCLLHYVIRC